MPVWIIFVKSTPYNFRTKNRGNFFKFWLLKNIIFQVASKTHESDQKAEKAE